MSKKKLLDQVKEQIKREIQEEDDPEYIPGEDRGNGSQRLGTLLFPRKSEEERIIDELLAGVDESKGFYLKLEKEISPNEWEFKERIDKYKHWSDLQWELTQLVRGKTKLEIEKTGKAIRWGSGRYRIIIWNQYGMRDKRIPYIMNIDAEEYNMPVPNFPGGVAPAADRLSELTDMLMKLNIVNPSLTPDQVQSQISGAFSKGMELAIGKEAKAESANNNMFTLIMNQMNESNKLMVGLLTAMIGNKPITPDPVSTMNATLETLKTLGVIGQPPVPVKSLSEQVIELKALGLIKSDDDAEKSIERVKLFMGLARDFSGAEPGERPGILEKIIDVFGPKIPAIIDTIGKIAASKGGIAMPTAAPVYAPITPVRPTLQPPLAAKDALGFPTGDIPSEPEQVPTFSEEDTAKLYAPAPVNILSTPKLTPDQIVVLADELFSIVSKKDYTSFDRITQVAGGFLESPEKVRFQIISGELTAQQLVGYIILFDRRHYQDRTNFMLLQDYVHKYVESFQPSIPAPMTSIPITPISPTMDVQCSVCGAIHTFDGEETFYAEQKESGKVVCGANGCENELHLPIIQ